MPRPSTLAELETDLARDLAMLNYPPAPWVPESVSAVGEPVADVLIAGAGMLGLTVAFALKRQGIGRLRLIDSAPVGHEGPWITYARMETLRSPKHLDGPAMGLPSLTCRAWFEAQWGEAAWAELDKIPRAMWMDYLNWYRHALGFEVENGVTLTAIRHAPHGLDLDLRHADGPTETMAARKLVLATGREGQARMRVPAPLAPFMGAGVSHTSQPIDFAALQGQDVAAIGLGASTIDNAAEALEAGARQVTLLVRSSYVPRVNKAKGTVYGGLTHGFPDLSPAWRLKLLDYIASEKVAPPRGSVVRVFKHHANAALWLDASVRSVAREGGRLHLETKQGALLVDHVILGTGFAIDMGTPPELAPYAEAIATHADVLADIATPEQAEWLDFPLLSPSFQLQEREPGTSPALEHIHCFTYAAAMSHGNVSGDIPQVSDGATRLARGMASDLFRAGLDQHWTKLEAFDDPELFGDEIPGVTAWYPPLD
ncbi:MAG: NAD(P)-binding domain-containing protein [Alphaproteobacteria bacterium]